MVTNRRRMDHRLAGSRSVVEDGEVEAAEALMVDDGVDLHDLAAPDSETHDRDGPPLDSDHHPRRPVHQNRPLCCEGLRDRERPTGHGGRAAEYHGSIRTRGSTVGSQDHVGIGDCHERIEVAGVSNLGSPTRPSACRASSTPSKRSAPQPPELACPSRRSMGLLVAVVVVATSFSDNAGGKLAFDLAKPKSSRLARVFCDGGFKTGFRTHLAAHHVSAEVVKRIHPGVFEVVPRRWVVERVWSWLMNNRRLQVDYERCPEVTEGFVWAAHTRLLLRRLATPQTAPHDISTALV
jgi:hypothetical protein